MIEAIDGPSESMTPELTKTMMAPADRNRIEILIAAQTIEALLEQIISHYFFPPSDQSPRSSDFTYQILKSEWCSFSSKIRLVIFIVESKEILTGHEKTSFEDLLRKTMDYRNAFAHGDFSTDGRKVKISYFKAKPRHRIVDDDWLTEIEENLRKCFERCLAVFHTISPPIEIAEMRNRGAHSSS